MIALIHEFRLSQKKTFVKSGYPSVTHQVFSLSTNELKNLVDYHEETQYGGRKFMWKQTDTLTDFNSVSHNV